MSPDLYWPVLQIFQFHWAIRRKEEGLWLARLVNLLSRKGKRLSEGHQTGYVLHRCDQQPLMPSICDNQKVWVCVWLLYIH